MRQGFGRQVHLLTICFTLGFMTERTVIIKTDDGHVTNAVWGNLTLPLGKLCFLPKEIPVEVFSLFGTKDIQIIKASYQTNYFDLHRTLPLYIADTVKHFHSNPSLWWAGQVAKFVLRPDKRLDILIENRKKELEFVFRTVGIFIETKTTIKQTGQYNFTNILKVAEKWFSSYERNTGLHNTQRRVFIASDEPSILTDITKVFSNFNVLLNTNVNHSHAQRSSLAGGIMLDTFMLSMCDYLICTMSSDICRLAFELMQSRHIDGSKRAKSLDCPYFIKKLYRNTCKLASTGREAIRSVINNVI